MTQSGVDSTPCSVGNCTFCTVECEDSCHLEELELRQEGMRQ